MPEQPGNTKRDYGKDAAVYQRGIAAFETGRYQEAVELLGSLQNSRNLSATLARFYLGQSHMHLGIDAIRSGDHNTAIRHLTIARDINPESSALSRYLAACYASQRKFDLAAAEIERDDVTGRPDAIRPIRLAHAFARDGRFEQAVETLVKVIEAEPHRIDVRVHLALLYGAAEHYEDAVCVLTEASEIAPFDAAVRFRLGMALAAAGDHAEAVEHLSVAQKLQPNDARMALMLAMAVNAARSARIKIAFNPVHGRLDVVEDQSLSTLGELIAKEPDFVEAFLALPRSEVDHEVFAMLAAIIEQALERQPDYADLYFHCSRVYDRLGRTDEAIRRADQALEINPRYVQALIHMARLYARSDQEEAAINRLYEAIRFGGDYPDVHYLLGELLRRHGDRPGARREFRRALELNSNYDAARHALAGVECA